MATTMTEHEILDVEKRVMDAVREAQREGWTIGGTYKYFAEQREISPAYAIVRDALSLQCDQVAAERTGVSTSLLREIDSGFRGTLRPEGLDASAMWLLGKKIADRLAHERSQAEWEARTARAT